MKIEEVARNCKGIRTEVAKAIVEKTEVIDQLMLAFLAGCITLSISAFYELIEWWVALAMGQGAEEFLGTQGDPWDAHKDMALASVGALIAMVVTATVNVRLDRDFAREWRESLRVKRTVPLGEEELERIAREEETRR